MIFRLLSNERTRYINEAQNTLIASGLLYPLLLNLVTTYGLIALLLSG